MISVVTNAVVALMIVTTGFEKVVGSMEMEFVPSPCQSSNSYGLVVGSYRPKEPYVDLYRKVCTTNFVFQRDYDACKEAVRYIQDNCVATNKYPLISQPMWDDELGVPLTEPMPVPAVIHRRKGGAK